MVIQKCPVNEIPVGAIRLSEKDALQHIWKEINGWKNSLDVAAFIYGPGVLSAFSGMTLYGYYRHIRRHLKLAHYMRFTMVSSGIILPSLFSAVSHLSFVTSDVVLQRPCATCTQTKAVALQTLFSIGYGLIIPYALGVYAANHYVTVERLPRFDDLPAMFKFWKRFARRLLPTTLFFIGLNVTAATSITFWEYVAFSAFYEKWIESQHKREMRLIELSSSDKK